MSKTSKTLEVVCGLGLVAMILTCNDSNTTGPDNQKKTLISGHVFGLGPEAGIEVTAYDYRGAVKVKQWGSAQTAQDGSYEIDLKAKYGEVLVEASADGATLSSVIDIELGGKASANLNPVSTLSAAYATFLVRTGVEDGLESAKTRADAVLFEHFGDVLPLTIPKAPYEDQTSLNPELVLGVLCNALQTEAQWLSSTATMGGLLKALSDDLSADGLLNGRDAVGRVGLGQAALSGDTLRTEFGVAIRSFLDSAENKTHFRLEQFRDVIEAIATAESEIFDGPPTPPDQTPPEVSILSPEQGAVVAGVVPVRVQASDVAGNLNRVVCSSPSGVILEQSTSQAGVFTGQLDSTKLADGALQISVTASDRMGNEKSTAVSVTVRNVGVLAGVVFKGPLAGAKVRAYRYDPTQTLLGSGDSGADGRFEIELGAYTGPLLLVAESGTYKEEAFGSDVVLSWSDYLSAIVPDYSPAFKGAVTLTPLTTWAAALANQLAKQGTAPAVAAAAANQKLSQHFGGLDLLGVVPVDLLSSDVNCSNLSDRVLYALYLAGLSQMGLQVSEASGYSPGTVVNAITLTAAIANDISDGVLDGRRGAYPIFEASYPLSSYTLRTDLARAINAWLNSNRNPCPISVVDVVEAGRDLAGDQSDLFPPNDPVIPVDDQGPTIVFSSHTNGQIVSGTVTVEAQASDLSGLAEFVVVEPAGFVDQIEAIDKVRVSIDTAEFTDRIKVRLQAADNYGNRSEAALELVIDRQGPSLSFEPPSGGVVRDPAFRLSGTASDPSGVASVKAGGRALQVDASGRFAYEQWTLVDGRNQVVVEAEDRFGNRTSTTYEVTLDKAPPRIDVVTPAGGTTWQTGQVVAIEASATDENGIRTMRVSAAGVQLEDKDQAPDRVVASIRPEDYGDGELALDFEAEDASGNVAKKQIAITIDNSGVLSGLVFKAPLKSASVKAFEWSGQQGPQKGIAGTDATGAYSLTVPYHLGGTLLLEATGGSYEEEARPAGTNVSLGAGDRLVAVVEHQAGSDLNQVMVSPFTTLAAELAAKLVTSGVTPVEATRRAREKIETIFGINLSSLPHDTRTPANDFNDSARMGLLLAGLSQLATETYGASAIRLLMALADDLKDGLLDGRKVNSPIPLGGKVLDANVLRAGLGRAVLRFLGTSDHPGPNNGTGLWATDPQILSWLDEVAGSLDPIFDRNQPPVEIDPDPPTITVNSPQNGEWVRGTVNVLVTVTDSQPMLITDLGVSEISDESVGCDGSGTTCTISWSRSVLQDGPVTWTITAVDRSGNRGSAALTLNFDNTAPQLIWGSPTNGEVISTSQVSISGAVSDSGVGLEYLKLFKFGSDPIRIDPSDDGNWSLALAESDGTQTYQVEAADKLGNTKTLPSRTVTVDTQPPTVSVRGRQSQGDWYSDNQWVRGEVIIRVEVQDKAIRQKTLTINGQAYTGSWSCDNQTSCSLDIRETPPNGDRRYEVVAWDQANHSTTATLTLRFDNTVPQLAWTAPTIDYINSGSYALSGTYTEPVAPSSPLTSLKIVRVQPAQGPEYTITPIVTPWTWNVINETDGPKTYRVIARDAAGNEASLDRSFTVDTAHPTVTLSGCPATGSCYANNDWVRGAVTIRGTVSDVNYREKSLTINGGSPVEGWSYDQPTNTYSLTISDTTANGERTYLVTAKDRANNETTATLTLRFDNTPPGLAWTAPDNNAFINTVNYELKGTATEPVTPSSPLVSLKIVRTQPGPETEYPIDPIVSPWTKQILGDLNAGPKTYRVVARDAAGNEAFLERSFTLDLVSPTISLYEFDWTHDSCALYCPTCSVIDCAPDRLTIDDDLMGGTPQFKKIKEKMNYRTLQDIENNNLPILAILARDDRTIDSSQLAVTYQVNKKDINEVEDGWSDPKTVEYLATEELHVLPISKQLDPRIDGAKSNDRFTVRIRVEDRAGNATEKAYRFTLAYIPQPVNATKDTSYAQNPDQYSLHTVTLETCTTSSSPPYRTCRDDGFAALLENSGAYPYGIRIAHYTIDNTGDNIKLRVTDGLRNSTAKVHILSAQRLVTGTYSEGGPDCETYRCPDGYVNDGFSTGANRCVSLGSFDSDDQSRTQSETVKLEMRQSSLSGAVTPRSAEGDYSLLAGQVYHFIVAIPYIEKSFIPGGDTRSTIDGRYYKYTYFGNPPENRFYQWIQTRNGICGGDILSLVGQNNLAIPQNNRWIRGLRVEHEVPNFSFEIARNEGSVDPQQPPVWVKTTPLRQTLNINIEKVSPRLKGAYRDVN